MSVLKESKTRKKKLRPVHKGGNKGAWFLKKNKQKKQNRLFYTLRENSGWGTWDRGRLLKDMCAFEPWEKKWPILTGENLLFSFLSFLERPHQCPRCPLTLRDTSSVSEWQWWWLWEGRRHSHTREWNISCGFVSVHTVLIYRPGDLHTAGWTWLLKADGRENKNTLRAMHIENAHICWKKENLKTSQGSTWFITIEIQRCCRFQTLGVWRASLVFAACSGCVSWLHLLWSTVLRQWVVPWRRSITATLTGREEVRPGGHQRERTYGIRQSLYTYILKGITRWGISWFFFSFLWNVSVQHVEHRQHIHKN